MDGGIFRLKEKILSELQCNWTIETMADAINSSAPHLFKLFKKETGITPIEFVRNARLEKSCEFLENSFLQMKQIGAATGMLNDSHFTRDFKKKYGITPTEYRRRYWEKIQTEKSNGQE